MSERSLAAKGGEITPVSVYVGFMRMVSAMIIEPFRLFPAFFFMPFSIYRRVQVTRLATALETLKFFFFAMFLTFALGARFDSGFLELFDLGTPFDEFIFEVSCFVFLILWSNIQFLILRVWSHARKLFQVTLAINAAFLGYMLILLVLGNVIFSVVELFLPILFQWIGEEPATIWEILSWGYYLLYAPLLFYFAYIGWLSIETNLSRIRVLISTAIAVLIAWEAVYYSLTYLKILLSWIKTYLGVIN